MNPLTTFVRSLGNDGARDNARTVLDAHHHEDWIVQGLARRLESTGPEPSTSDPKIAATTTAA